jgi:hypothetical protein
MGEKTWLPAPTAMRRALTLVLTVLLLSAGHPGAHGGPRPGAAIRREAQASWTVSTSQGRISYWVWARRLTSHEGMTVTRVRLTKYRCVESSRSSFCRPLHQTDEIVPDENFSFDDTLGSANLVFRRAGARHHVEWTAHSSPGRSELDRECTSSPVGNAARGAGRVADSSGRVFGRRLGPSDEGRWDFSYLSIMVNLRSCGV